MNKYTSLIFIQPMLKKIEPILYFGLENLLKQKIISKKTTNPYCLRGYTHGEFSINF